MVVRQKILNAARWAANDAREQVTGGFRRNSFGGNPTFTYKWLREALSPKVSDKALTAALEELVSEQSLQEANGNYRLISVAAQPKQIRVLIGIAYADLRFSYPVPAMARALCETDSPVYRGRKPLLEGQSYVQRRSQTEVVSESNFGPNLIRTNMHAASREERLRKVQEYASGLLIAGTKIWFREDSA